MLECHDFGDFHLQFALTWIEAFALETQGRYLEGDMRENERISKGKETRLSRETLVSFQ